MKKSTVPKWLKRGVRLELREYVTVDSLTVGGFWAKKDNGNPLWIPFDHLGVVWNKLKVRRNKRKLNTPSKGKIK